MYCEKCGNELKEEAKFCGKCGNKVGEDTASVEHYKSSKKDVLILIVILAIAITSTVFVTYHWDKVKKLVTGVEIERKEESVDKKYTQEEIDNMIGKYVDYQPTYGTYTAKAEMTGVVNSSEGIKGDQKFETEDMKWRIWNIDDSSIMLISDEPTSYSGEEKNGYIDFYGEKVSKNGPTILNELCKTCYTNSEYKGMQARSLNLKDIEKVLDEEIFNAKKYKEEIIEKYKTTVSNADANVDKIEVSEWACENLLIDSGAGTNLSIYYQSPMYNELLKKSQRKSYLATNFEGHVELSSKIGTEHHTLKVSGICALDIGEAGTLIFYEEQDSDLMENFGGASIRPIVTIPLKSCEIDTSTKGTELDMWKISAK